MSDPFEVRRRSLAVACGSVAALLAMTHEASADTYTDAIGDNYGDAYVDIASVDVTSDATSITFQINLNPAANLLAENGSQIYGNYEIAFQTGESGNTTLFTPYGNQIGVSSGTGMDYWLGSWANNSTTPPFSGGAELHRYDGEVPTRVAGIGTSNPYVELPFTLAPTSVTVTIPLASLGLAQGDTFKFDVWTTFGQPGGQSAYDALGKQTRTTDPGTPYPPVTPYDAGSMLLTYTVGGAAPVSAAWSGSASTTWSASGNWSGGVVPNGAGHTATFGNLAGSTATVNVDGEKTVGTLNFTGATSYTLGGSGPLVIDASTGSGAVNVTAGSHTISTAVTFADDTTISVTPANSTLAFTGTVSAAARTITKSGSGAATFRNVRAAGLNVQAGSVRVTAQPVAFSAAGTSVLSTLSIASGATLDLANNALILDYAAGSVGSLVADVRQLLASGRLASAGASAASGIGYVDNAVAPTRVSFGDVAVDASSLLIGLTLKGDTNLDRTVNFDDLLALAQAYGTTSDAAWQRGDFNYDGAVGFDDLLALAQNYSQSAVGITALEPAFAADWALARSLVPEPATFLGGAMGAAVLLRRARRSVPSLH